MKKCILAINVSILCFQPIHTMEFFKPSWSPERDNFERAITDLIVKESDESRSNFGTLSSYYFT
ncbi:MAG: hypothetical protein AB7F19_00015 [Candidatus Babeliales bacterium]